MRHWTVATPSGCRCRYCGRQIPIGDPVQIITFPGRPLLPQVRCVEHANSPVDRNEVEQERWRIENDRRRETPPPSQTWFTRQNSATSQVFDAKAAAAGRDD